MPFTVLSILSCFQKREDQMTSPSKMIRRNFKKPIDFGLKTGNKNGGERERLKFRRLQMKIK